MCTNLPSGGKHHIYSKFFYPLFYFKRKYRGVKQSLCIVLSLRIHTTVLRSCSVAGFCKPFLRNIFQLLFEISYWIFSHKSHEYLICLTCTLLFTEVEIKLGIFNYLHTNLLNQVTDFKGELCSSFLLCGFHVYDRILLAQLKQSKASKYMLVRSNFLFLSSINGLIYNVSNSVI